MGDVPKSTIWKIVEGVAITAILAATGFAWNTYTKTNEMQVQLSGLCVALPKIEARIDRHENELSATKLAGQEIKGRVYYLEKSLEVFERRIDKYLK